MGLFSRRREAEGQGSYLPPHVIPGLEPYGRFAFDPQGSGVDPLTLMTNEYDFLLLRRNDPDRFIAEIAAAAIPAGGWTLLGAMKLLWECDYLQAIPANADATAILASGCDLARGMGFLWAQLRMDEQAAYVRAGGHPW